MMQSANVQALGCEHRKPLFLATAVVEWLLVLPATFFLAAAAIRLLQPRQFQPAHACWIIFEWARAHFTRLNAAVIFLGLPIVALLAGGAALCREWRKNAALRQDAAAALAIVRRQYGAICLFAAVLVAGGLLTFVVDHLIVG